MDLPDERRMPKVLRDRAMVDPIVQASMYRWLEGEITYEVALTEMVVELSKLSVHLHVRLAEAISNQNVKLIVRETPGEVSVVREAME